MYDLCNSGEKDFQEEGNTRTKASRQISLAHLSNSQESQSAYNVGNGLGVRRMKVVEVREVVRGHTLETSPTHFHQKFPYVPSELLGQGVV